MTCLGIIPSIQALCYTFMELRINGLRKFQSKKVAFATLAAVSTGVAPDKTQSCNGTLRRKKHCLLGPRDKVNKLRPKWTAAQTSNTARSSNESAGVLR